MRCFKKLTKNKSKNQVIWHTLLILAIAIFVIGCYLIIDNSMKLARGYKSNKSTSMIFTLTDTKQEDVNFSHTLKSPKTQLEEPVLYDKRPESGDEFGELYIPKLDARLPIFEGTSEDELELGVGHYADSVLPGEKDNTVLAGHRDTVFRRLGEVGVGDSLIVRVYGREFEYKVVKVRIVDKEDRTVIVPRPRATLTVSTCYPFSFIGAAPKRYVLIGYLIS